MSLLTHQVTFNSQTGANKGKIYVTVVPPENYVSADVYIEITDPTGTVIKSWGVSPDLQVLTDPITWESVNIPKSDGEYIKGTYKVNLKIAAETYGDSAPEPTQYDVATYSYCPGSTVGCVNNPTLTSSMDCMTGKLTVTDITNYDNVEFDSYLLSIIPPTLPNISIQGATTVNRSLTVGVPYTNVNYQGTMSATGTRTYTVDNFEFYDLFEITAYKSILINCFSDICTLIECADKKFNDSCTLVVDRERILYLMAKIGVAQLCSNCNDVSAYLDELKALVDCDCGTSIPKPLVTACGQDWSIADYAIMTTAGELVPNARLIIVESVDMISINIDASLLTEHVEYTMRFVQTNTVLPEDIVSPLQNIFGIGALIPVANYPIYGNYCCKFMVHNGNIYILQQTGQQ